MMSNPEYMNPDPGPDPGDITATGSLPSAALYGAVAPHEVGPAPYGIQAPHEDLSDTVEAAGRVSGAGVVYPQGPRQAAAEEMLGSAAGYGDFDVLPGFTGEWPCDVEPPGM